MSTINTNAINVNYPVPGVNNNSQGFRDNFASIKTNLNLAATEITDLQTKVVVKQALTGTVTNNDMANTLISNASTRSFRATTYNLGNALSGTVLVDVSLGDVQYGTVAGNTVISFGSWAPTGTQSNIQLNLSVSNTAAVISFPPEVIIDDNTGINILENFANIAGVPTVTVPSGVTQLNYLISTTDCGTTLYIQPINRPKQATQVHQRLILPTGLQGDVAGAVAVNSSFDQLLITNTTVTSNILTTTGNTSQLYTDLPIVFTGTAFGGPTAGSTYYVRNVVNTTTFTVSSTIGGANLSLTTLAGTMYANPVSYLYVATDNYNATAYAKNVLSTTVTTNAVTLNNTTSLVVNAPIVFTANIAELKSNTVYFIKSIASPNITVSRSRTNGVADTVITLTSNSTATTANIFIGNDIWKRLPLTSW